MREEISVSSPDEMVLEPSAVVPGHLFFPCAGVVTSCVSGHNEKYLILAFAQSMGYSLKGTHKLKWHFLSKKHLNILFKLYLKLTEEF